MAGTTRLKLYRAALRLCGAESIADLSEDIEPRRLLDEVWDDNGVRKCLEMGSWDFALRTLRLDFDVSNTPSFGYRRAFSKTEDWVTTTKICSDEFFQAPLTRYVDEVGFLYSDLDEMFVQFVSDDAAFGSDLTKWTGSFVEYAEAFFAAKIVHRLTSDKDRVLFLLGRDGSGEKSGYMHEKLRTARSKDAQQSPAKFLPRGTWTRARGGGGHGGPFGDQGTSGSLTG